MGGLFPHEGRSPFGERGLKFELVDIPAIFRRIVDEIGTIGEIFASKRSIFVEGRMQEDGDYGVL